MSPPSLGTLFFFCYRGCSPPGVSVAYALPLTPLGFYGNLSPASLKPLPSQLMLFIHFPFSPTLPSIRRVLLERACVPATCSVSLCFLFLFFYWQVPPPFFLFPPGRHRDTSEIPFYTQSPLLFRFLLYCPDVVGTCASAPPFLQRNSSVSLRAPFFFISTSLFFFPGSRSPLTGYGSFRSDNDPLTLVLVPPFPPPPFSLTVSSGWPRFSLSWLGC